MARNKGKASISKQELFELYKRVQNKDRKAEDALIAEYKRVYPENKHVWGMTRGTCEYYRKNLHTMYLHMYR